MQCGSLPGWNLNFVQVWLFLKLEMKKFIQCISFHLKLVPPLLWVWMDTDRMNQTAKVKYEGCLSFISLGFLSEKSAWTEEEPVYYFLQGLQEKRCVMFTQVTEKVVQFFDLWGDIWDWFDPRGLFNCLSMTPLPVIGKCVIDRQLKRSAAGLPKSSDFEEGLLPKKSNR